jgi:REP element-mobilizing transposase RayT
MENYELLQPGKFYHIYNRGINGEKLFLCEENYQHFLKLYTIYIDPIADTYAWVLMPNHFHLLVRIKENIRYKYYKPDNGNEKENEQFELVKWETVQVANEENSDNKIPVPNRHFAHLFNAYTKYLNLRIPRHGNLFERPFKRKKIDNYNYLKKVLIYIHQNPVHHDFCKHPMEYPWSSFLTCISTKPTKLKRDAVMGWFDNQANFIHIHEGKVEVEDIEHWLGLD